MKDISISGFDNSSQIIDKLIRDFNILNNAIINQESTEINDAFVNFYTYAYHIKDWLKKEGYNSVEGYINEHLELNDSLYEIYKSGIRCDSTAYAADSTVPINATTYYIKLKSGKEFEILYFVKKILELWKSYINETN